jgi:predicted RNA-binding Zn-ribbon protein involved in translation (DUF1610 family)
MTYTHECPACGEVEIEISIREYPGSKVWFPCPVCGHAYARRVFTPVYHQEDRRHHGGARFSRSLGRVAPQSRSEMRLLEKSGVVFDSFKDPQTSEGKAAKEYQQATAAGATHEEAERAAPWPQPKTPSFPEYVAARERAGWSPRQKLGEITSG